MTIVAISPLKLNLIYFQCENETLGFIKYFGIKSSRSELISPNQVFFLHKGFHLLEFCNRDKRGYLKNTFKTIKMTNLSKTSVYLSNFIHRLIKILSTIEGCKMR